MWPSVRPWWDRRPQWDAKDVTVSLPSSTRTVVFQSLDLEGKRVLWLSCFHDYIFRQPDRNLLRSDTVWPQYGNICRTSKPANIKNPLPSPSYLLSTPINPVSTFDQSMAGMFGEPETRWVAWHQTSPYLPAELDRDAANRLPGLHSHTSLKVSLDHSLSEI